MNCVYLTYNNFDSLDTSKLEQLIALGKDIEEDVLGQLVTIHRDTSELAMVEMEKFLNLKNFEDLKRSAHKFKSSSANLGLMRLHKLCSDLETMLGKGAGVDWITVKEYVESIQYECNQTNQKLASYPKAA